MGEREPCCSAAQGERERLAERHGLRGSPSRASIEEAARLRRGAEAPCLRELLGECERDWQRQLSQKLGAATAAPAAERAPGRSRARWRAYAAVASLAVVAYGNSLSGSQTADDFLVLRDNPDVRGTARLADVFRHDYWGNDMFSGGWTHKSYRPLTILTFRAQHALVGLPGHLRPYHIANTLLHGAASAAGLAVLRCWGLGSFASFSAACVFAVHPVHVEAVANVSGRAELLSAALSLVAFLLLHRASTRAGGWASYAAAAPPAVAAMLCKETGVMVLLAGAAWITVVQRGPTLAAEARQPVFSAVARLAAAALSDAVCLGLLASFFLLAAARAAFTGGTELDMHASCATISGQEHLHQRFLTISLVQAQALLLCLWPDAVGMAHNHHAMRPVTAVADPRNLLGTVVQGSFWAAALWLAAETSSRSCAPWKRSALFGLVWFVLFYLPASHAFFSVGLVVADRVMYLPSLGIYGAAAAAADAALCRSWPRARDKGVGGGVGRATGRGTWRALILLAAVLVLSRRTWNRCSDWASPLSLYEATLRVFPDDAHSHYGYGYDLYQAFKRDVDPDGALLASAERTASGAVDTAALARSHPEGGALLEKSLAHLRTATALDPSLGVASEYLCRVQFGLGSFRECATTCLAAYNAGTAEAAFMYAMCLLQDGVPAVRVRRAVFLAQGHKAVQTSFKSARITLAAGVACAHPAFFDEGAVSAAADARLPRQSPVEGEPAAPDLPRAVGLHRRALAEMEQQVQPGRENLESVRRNLAILLAAAGAWEDADLELDACRTLCLASAGAEAQRCAHLEPLAEALRLRDRGHAALDARLLVILTLPP